MITLPNKKKFMRNFSQCRNWEDKYLYIIELGNNLPQYPQDIHIPSNLISGCQSQVWIAMTVIDAIGNVQLYGDSDAVIVKGLIAITFILYKDLTITEISALDVRPFFHSIDLSQHLSLSRSQGLESMVFRIRDQATKHTICYARDM